MSLSIQLVSERLLINVSHSVNVFIEISWVVCSLTLMLSGLVSTGLSTNVNIISRLNNFPSSISQLYLHHAVRFGRYMVAI